MEVMDVRNVGEQGSGETSVASEPTSEAMSENNQGVSSGSDAGPSDVSSSSETNSQSQETTGFREVTTPQPSTSAVNDQKVTFKVPDLSKIMRVPKVLPSPKSVSLGSENPVSVSTSDSSDNSLNDKQTQPVVPKKNLTVTPSRSTLENLSPAEKLKQLEIPLAYKEPPWGGLCEEKYSFEVLKNGTIIDNIDLTTKTFHVFGRLPSCDVTLEHPSLSRHHTVVQYCGKTNAQYSIGWYLYDLDSTHGTWINKNRVLPKVYYRIRVGHVIKFGGSSRLFIMQGPVEDSEEESELSVTELKEQREKKRIEMELRQKHAEEMKALERSQEEQEAQDKGCSWGIFDDDVDDEAPDSENPFALPDLQNEDLYVDDPKKALKSYYEREGLEPPEYTFEDSSYGQHKCSIELPIDDTNTGKPIVVEVQVSGKKKEAVIQCALEACRMLDRYGELRKANQESRKKKGKNWEEQDYYDSDDDDYLDRTGEIERKRQQRMKKAGKLDAKAETYESLVEKLTEVQNQVKALEEKLAKAKQAESDCQADGLDALDAFMTSIRSGAMDTKTRMKLKLELLDLRKEQQRLEKFVNVARPASLPPVHRSLSSAMTALPMVGKVRALNKNRIKGPTLPPAKRTVPEPSKESDDSEEEEEDDSETKPKQEIKKIKLFSVQKDPGSKDTEALTANSGAPKDSTQLDAETKVSQKLGVKEETITKKEETSMEVCPDEVSSKDSKESSPQKSKSVSMEISSSENKEKTTKGTEPEPPQQKTDTQQKMESSIRRRKGPQMKSTGEMVKKLKQEAESKEYSADDPDYSVWVPPTGQTGDGKTSLNEKFGY